MSHKVTAFIGDNHSRQLPLLRVTDEHLIQLGFAPLFFCAAWNLQQGSFPNAAAVCGTEYVSEGNGCLCAGVGFGCRFTAMVRDGARRGVGIFPSQALTNALGLNKAKPLPGLARRKA